MQVLKVTFGVILLGICVLFSLRFYGLGQYYQVYDHPVMKLPTPWVIAWGGDSQAGPSHTKKALLAASGIEGVFLGVNLQMNAEKHFYVIPAGLAISKEESFKKFKELTDAEVKSINLGEGESPLTLEEFLNEFPNQPVLLWINDNIENIDLRLEPILKKYLSRSNILIHSEFDNVVKSLKKLLPELLYGTGVGQRVRMLMLGSLWLEPAASIDGDFLIAPLKEQGVNAVSLELKKEILRRQKVFILGPLNNISDNDQAVTFGATGYLTSFPRDLKNKLQAPSARVDL